MLIGFLSSNVCIIASWSKNRLGAMVTHASSLPWFDQWTCGSRGDGSIANDLDVFPERHTIGHQLPGERPWVPVLERGIERDI